MTSSHAWQSLLETAGGGAAGETLIAGGFVTARRKGGKASQSLSRPLQCRRRYRRVDPLSGAETRVGFPRRRCCPPEEARPFLPPRCRRTRPQVGPSWGGRG